MGLALPGNGTIVATHTNRRRLFEKAASLIVQMAGRYYFEGDDSVLPRNIATKAAFENAMSLDIAMGGSTNTVLHLLAKSFSRYRRATSGLLHLQFVAVPLSGGIGIDERPRVAGLLHVQVTFVEVDAVGRLRGQRKSDYRRMPFRGMVAVRRMTVFSNGVTIP